VLLLDDGTDDTRLNDALVVVLVEYALLEASVVMQVVACLHLHLPCIVCLRGK
jgi:hypothetical protein